MNLRSLLSASFVGVALTAASATAFADVLPPNSGGCDDASPQADGQSCLTDDGASGTCQAQTCNGLDYSNRSDAGIPGTKTYACSICVTPDGGTVVTSSDGGTTTTTASGSGCNLGGADIGASAILLGLVLPLLARRRKQDRRS